MKVLGKQSVDVGQPSGIIRSQRQREKFIRQTQQHALREDSQVIYAVRRHKETVITTCITNGNVLRKFG